MDAKTNEAHFFARANRVRESARRKAINHALQFNPAIDYANSPAPSIFGEQFRQRAMELRFELNDAIADKLPFLLALESRRLEFWRWYEALFMAEFLAEFYSDLSDNHAEIAEDPIAAIRKCGIVNIGQFLTTPHEYCNAEMWDEPQHSKAPNLVYPNELLSDSGFSEYPEELDLFSAGSLILFFEAARLREIGDPRAMDVLSASLRAAELAGAGLSDDFHADENRRRGAAGGKKRQEPMAQLRKWTLTRYKCGSWPSPRRASFELAPAVIEEGKRIGANMAETNAQRTIYEWILKASA